MDPSHGWITQLTISSNRPILNEWKSVVLDEHGNVLSAGSSRWKTPVQRLPAKIGNSDVQLKIPYIFQYREYLNMSQTNVWWVRDWLDSKSNSSNNVGESSWNRANYISTVVANVIKIIQSNHQQGNHLLVCQPFLILEILTTS